MQQETKRGVKARRQNTQSRPAHRGTKGSALSARISVNGVILKAPASSKAASNGNASVSRIATNGYLNGMDASSALSVGPSDAHPTTAILDMPPPPAPPREVEPPPPSRPASRLADDLLARGQALWQTGVARVRRLTLEQWLWIGVLSLAALLRFWGLGDKPVHHDESMHAYFSLVFAENPSSYAYDPLLHGPFQFHAEGLVFAVILGLQHLFASNALGNPWINDTTARILPACFGLGIVALPLGLRRELGRAGALVAAFLLAVSPSFVYFSRFLREDIYFNFFMFAMVVCAVQFAHKRTMRWFIALFAATILAYATFEGIFLTLAIFIGFLALLAVWEFAHTVAGWLPASFSESERLFFSRAGLLLLLGACASLLALAGLRKLSQIGAYINANPTQSQAQATQLENNTVAILLYASILIALIVIGTLLWQMYRDDLTARPRPADLDEDDDFALDDAPMVRTGIVGRLDTAFSAPARLVASLRERVDPDRQRFLSLLLGTSWVQWFVAFVVAWMLFAALFWIVPGSIVQTWGQGFQRGVGQGIWQGLYYWLEQQPIARGGQPWYYYLLLIPLYEQLAVVFGAAGIVYSLFRPTRFRLFLIWWFVLSLGLYSWAGEKMPWLSIHILLPLMLLAAIAVERALVGTMGVIRRLAASDVATLRAAPLKPATSVLGVALALLLLIPMIHSMLTLSQVDAANGPKEMMVYVQTTTDVTTILNRIAYADKVLYHGQHKIRIGVGPGMEWPFYWYLDPTLRDYPNVYFGYQAGSKSAPPVDVAILMPAGDNAGNDAQGFMAAHPTGYKMKEYRLRAWFDEGYKPLPCVAKPGHPCPSPDFASYGMGLGNYLTYGSFPPTNAKFALGPTISRLWSWLWVRQPLGDTHGSTDFVFVVRNGLPISA